MVLKFKQVLLNSKLLKEDDLSKYDTEEKHGILEKAFNYTEEQKKHIRDYTEGSKTLNQRLIEGIHPLHKSKTHNGIISAAKPTGHSYNVYSGTRDKDFSKYAKASKDGILHSPAHISTSHDYDTANKFTDIDHEGKKNLISVHITPSDKVVYAASHSSYPYEKETIIPAGTKLKYSHSEHKGDTAIHHFTIYDQSEVKPSKEPTFHDIDSILKGDDYSAKTEAVEYPHVTKQHIDNLIKNKQHYIASKAKNLTDQHISKIMDSVGIGNHVVSMNIAHNKKDLNPSHITKIIEKTEVIYPAHFDTLIGQKHLTKHHLSSLVDKLDSDDSTIHKNLLSHKLADNDIRNQYLNHKKWDYRSILYNHPSFTKEEFDHAFANETNTFARQHMWGSKHFDKHHAEKELKNPILDNLHKEKLARRLQKSENI